MLAGTAMEHGVEPRPHDPPISREDDRLVIEHRELDLGLERVLLARGAGRVLLDGDRADVVEEILPLAIHIETTLHEEGFVEEPPCFPEEIEARCPQILA